MSDTEEFNFKIIVALKVEGVQSLTCELRFMDRVKLTELPQSEGQFFDIQELDPAANLTIVPYYQSRKLNEVTVKLPDNIFENEETELSDVAKISFNEKKKQATLKLKYFIIILNKKIFLEKNQKSVFKNNISSSSEFFSKDQPNNQSPSTRKYLQSQQEHEDSKYNQAINKRMLQQPPKLNDSLNKSDLSDQQSQPALKLTPSKSNHTNSPYAKYGGASSPRSSREIRNRNDFLTKQITSLEVQLRSYPGEIESFKNQLAESEKGRNQLLEELKKMQTQNVSKEQPQKEANNDSDLKKILQLENQIDDLKVQLAQKNNQIQEFKDKNALIDEFAKLCKEQQTKLEDQDKKIRELSALLGRDDNKKPKEAIKQNKEKALQDQMNKLRSDLLKEQQKNQQLQISLDNALSRIQLLQIQGFSNKQLSDLNDRLKNDNNELRGQVNHLQETVDNLREQISKLENRPTHTSDDNLKSEIGELKKQIRERDIQVGKKDHQILELKSELQDLKLQFDNLRAGLSGSQNKNLLIENSSLLQTVNELTRQLRNINKQLLEARLTAKDYEREAEEKESQIVNLKHLILSFKERLRRGVAYIPELNDRTDKELANYLNNQEDVEILKKLFVRESEGVYQFGSKKIYVKVDQDKIQIRSGGGFMTIEEFLQMFSQIELEKQMKSDPLLSMQKNKALYKKIDDMKSVNKMRPDQLSPMRKSGKL